MTRQFHLDFPFLLIVTLALQQLSATFGITFEKLTLVHSTNNISESLVIPEVNGSETSTGLREKRQDGQSRSLAYLIGPKAEGPGPGPAPLCFEREVYGTCRYRTAPDECFRHEWTAYATIVNLGYTKITSFPEGLLVYPEGHGRVRVFVKSSCCNPLVQFIAWDLFHQRNECIVDVRELQNLHPGEIAGIVIGVLLFFIIVIAIIAFCVRRQRQKKLEKETVIFGRSLTRSKSRSESMSRAPYKT